MDGLKLKSMKHTPTSVCLVFLLVATGCLSIFTDKCGDSINLGDFRLMPESKADWFPYLNLPELTFSNSAGKTIALRSLAREETMTFHSLGEICREGWADSAEEYFMGEWLHYVYGGSFDGISYELSMVLYVDPDRSLYTRGQAVSSILYDIVSYHSLTSREPDIGVGGSVYLITSYRGNTNVAEDLNFLDWDDFAEEIIINGVAYDDVWYFNREGVPSLYVQKGRGIIAFAGMDDEVWVLQ